MQCMQLHAAKPATAFAVRSETPSPGGGVSLELIQRCIGDKDAPGDRLYIDGGVQSIVFRECV